MIIAIVCCAIFFAFWAGFFVCAALQINEIHQP